MSKSLDALKAYSWTPQPKPAQLVSRVLNECLDQSPAAAKLAKRMLSDTGTRMLDWIDHFGLRNHDPVIAELPHVGYVQTETREGDVVWNHPGGMFPRMRQLRGNARHLAIKVDSVADFLFAHGLTDLLVKGEPFAPLRVACISHGTHAELWIVERHGCRYFEPTKSRSGDLPIHAIAHHAEALRLRRRDFESDQDGFADANKRIDAAIADLGRDRACDLFFAGEREYWLRRNRAGQIQLARQQALGLGWANHDHHTYRSSRESFVPLIAFLEKLGFDCRERFYAGREAGWGAQVIEHTATGITIFADVDLSPDEVSQDFSHEPLAPSDKFGTVGLWCALHGDSFLQAGLHHLECQFDFTATRDQLKQVGIDTMPPFTDFPYLRQAFTRGEQWPVKPARVERLRASGKITEDQAQQFLTNGALGSHLEILQRDDGYKGFNQTGINEIITATDPRRASREAHTAVPELQAQVQ